MLRLVAGDLNKKVPGFPWEALAGLMGQYRGRL